MNDLHDALNEYTPIRRSLGFTLRLSARLPRSFVALVERSGSPFITTGGAGPAMIAASFPTLL